MPWTTATKGRNHRPAAIGHPVVEAVAVLTQVADGVLVHRSELLRNNTVVVDGRAGVLLVDPGITDGEMACLADDLAGSGRTVAAGFATHPDWDHVLWHRAPGGAPRHRTDRGSAFVADPPPDPARGSVRA